MLDKLPNGWVKTTLGEIVQPSRERASPAQSPNLRYIGLEHIEPQTMRLLGYGYARNVHSSSVRFSKGDVLYAKMRPYLNKVWLAKFGGICSAEFLVFAKREGLNSQFLAMRLNAEDFVTFANRQVSGDRPRVNFEKLSRFPVLLPPMAEQERIVAKLSAALLPVQRAETAARRAQERLDKYHDAVLKAAVTGELTHEWREKQWKNKDLNIDSGETLLRHLLAARRARWEHTELQRLRSAEKEPKNDSWKLRYPEPRSPYMDELPNIPTHWAWASLEMVAEIGSGVSVSQNRLLKNPVELPYIRVANVLRGYLDLSNIKKIRIEKENIPQYLLQKGDILFNEGGDRDKLGRGWVWEGQINKCVHQNHVFRARLIDKTLLNARFISHWGNTFGQHFFLRHATQTINLASINRSVLSRLPIPIPPFAEQTEIIRVAEQRIAAANRLSKTLGEQLVQASAMRQSLLREAFDGLLIPQNPNDESASVLLERLHLRRIGLDAAQRKAKSHTQLKTSVRNNMKKSVLTPATLAAAFERIGQKANAELLFRELGCAPDETTTFYETLRLTPEVLRAFEKEVAKQPSRKRATSTKKKKLKQKGHFRLVDLWLEDFKNLKDYSVQFNSAQGLDVVLGWNGMGKSNLFESLVIIFRDLHEWWERNHWSEQPMNGYKLSYEMDEHLIRIVWNPVEMKRPMVTSAAWLGKSKGFGKPVPIARTNMPLPRFVFGYYSGPTNRLAEHFQPMNQAHYARLRDAISDDSKTLATLLEQRRFFCAETHHAKYVLLAFFYRKDPEINRFLRERLRITGFESALFIIRKPRWARSGAKANDFWGAKGVMRRVLERLRSFAIAPMLVEQNVTDGYRTTKEDHYYFFLPDLARLHAFAGEYDDARTFFLALESTDFSELIHDVKIQVRVRTTNSEDAPITFREMSEGEQQLLMVLGLMRFTKSLQSLVLLDEPDTHLNPHWNVDYLKLLTKIMSDGTRESDEQLTSQILISTHDPLVIASLVKEQIHLLKRDLQTGVCKWVPASISPRGLGFTGILTSEMFGFRSDLDEETLADLDNKVRLMAMEGQLKPSDEKKLEAIDKRLAETGFQKAFSDPYYAAFVRAWGRKYSELMADQQFLSPVQMEEIERIADEVLEEARAEVENEVAD